MGTSLSDWLTLDVGKQEHCAFLRLTSAGMWKFVKRTIKRGESPADQQCCESSVSKETTAATKVSTRAPAPGKQAQPSHGRNNMNGSIGNLPIRGVLMSSSAASAKPLRKIR